MTAGARLRHWGTIALIVAAPAEADAQRYAPVGVRRQAPAAAAASLPRDTAIVSDRSRSAVALHDGAIGTGVGALAGALYLLVGTHQPRVTNHELDGWAYAIFTVGGAVAGLVVGATVGAVRGGS